MKYLPSDNTPCIYISIKPYDSTKSDVFCTGWFAVRQSTIKTQRFIYEGHIIFVL